MLYQIGEYAYPGANAVLYAMAFAITVGALCGAYSVYRAWSE